MAEVGSTIVSLLIKDLHDIGLKYINLSLEAKQELEKLKGEFEFMEAYLKDAPFLKEKKGSKVFQVWEKQVREAVVLAEDIIASCKAHKAKKSFGKWFSTKGLSHAEQVKSLRADKVKTLLEYAGREFANLQIAGPSRESRQKGLRRENIVGREMETTKGTIIHQLIKEIPEKLEVISITGMPGLGKTTLAWIILNDREIEQEFKTRIWVYVSQVFKIEDVYLTILKELNKVDLSGKDTADTVDLSGKDTAELKSLVEEKLKKRKFLIVFDDVWETDAWKEIQEVLPMDNKMGNVLLTSRYDSVASCASSRSRSHKLDILKDEESWELLQLEVYGKVSGDPKKFEGLGRLIAKNCCGLPLPIVVIGGIIVERLKTKEDATSHEKRTVWEDVSKSMILDKDKDKQIANIISLSYTNLPQDLKKCFLYLGMFPGGIEIPSWKLTQMWIAEGFIEETSSENIAQEYLMELINRNLLIVSKTKSSDGEVKTCSVHDIIRGFCIEKAADGKENLFQEIKLSKEGVFQPSIDEIQKLRRLCIHSSVEEFLGKKPKAHTAYSFLVSSRPPFKLETKDIPFLINAFDVLRVLDANNTIRFHEFPSKLITKLGFLKYISLSIDKFTVLPKAISNLSDIQTLLVETSSPTLKVEANIWKMKQLKHLKTKASIILQKDGKGEGGECLQTLSRLSPKSCTDTVFNKAKNLKTLGIRGDLNTLMDSKCLKKLERLEKLKLVHDVKNPLRGLPQGFPPKLRNLTLSATSLAWTHMSTIGELTDLRVLKLKLNAFIGDRWNVQVGGFRCLELLYIEQTDLKVWTSSHDAFPELTDLVLKNCEKLLEIPVDIVQNLEMLSMKSVNRYMVSSAKKIKLAENHGLKLIIAPEDEIIQIED